MQAGIRPVIAVECDPTKPQLSAAIAKTHHHNFSEYGCRIIQLTVQEVARLGFLGFPRRPDYLHASPVCANVSLAHTAKAGIALETADDLTAAMFPDWYEFPNDTTTAGSIIGYSVPPCFAAQLFTDIQRQLAGV